MHAPSPHVERYYWAADVLVLPSHREPFGRVAIEAFAAGLVPLVSRDSGSATGVAQVSRRLVFEPDDRGALAAAIVDILSSDAETRSGWIDAGCRILDRTYRAAVVVPQIERVYLETASRPK
jgi:glycosyltransferase involved in cell wall biosynthesis